MAEYIEREALERSLNERSNRLFKLHGRHDHYVQGFNDCVGRVEEFPAADVATVRHGRWVHEHISEGYAWVICSECEAVIHKILINKRLNYCPNCGAKMDGVDDE